MRRGAHGAGRAAAGSGGSCSCRWASRKDGEGEVEDDETKLWDKLAALDQLGKHLGLVRESEAPTDAAL